MTEKEASKSDSGIGDSINLGCMPNFPPIWALKTILLMLLLCLATGFTTKKEDYDKLIGQVEISKNQDKSLEICNQAIALRPDISKGYSLRCILLGNRNEFKSAMLDCKKSIQNALQPEELYLSYIANGYLYERLQDYDKAIEYYQKVNEMFSQKNRPDPSVNHLLGQIYYRKYKTHHKQADFDNALKYLNLSNSINPNNWLNYHLRGALYTQLNAYILRPSTEAPPFTPIFVDEAIDDLNKAFQLAPKGAQISKNYSFRSRAYTIKYLVTCEKSYVDKALSDEKTAIELEPEEQTYKILSDPKAYNNIKDICIKRKRNYHQ